jgi:hypothetical protein
VVANAYVIETVEDLEFAVSMTVNQPVTQGNPGDTVWWQLQIENEGNVEDTYVFSVFGLGLGWSYRFKVGTSAVTELVLGPGEGEAVLMELDIPEEFVDVPSDRVDITVKVGSLSEATASDNAQLTLNLKGILDLTLDVSVSTSEPVVGKTVVFTVTVKNLGPDDVEGVNVFAYYGDGPDDEYERKSVSAITANNERLVEFEWRPYDPGQVTVRIVVNPQDEDGAIWEIDYDNNEWVEPMKVSEKADEPIYESFYFWLFIVVIIVILLVAALASRGGEGEEEAVEVVEEGDEDLEEDEEYEDEDLEEDEEYEDEDLEEEEYEEEYEDEPPSEPKPAYSMDEKEEEAEADRSAFTVGRM